MNKNVIKLEPELTKDNEIKLDELIDKLGELLAKEYINLLKEEDGKNDEESSNIR